MCEFRSPAGCGAPPHVPGGMFAYDGVGPVVSGSGLLGAAPGCSRGRAVMVLRSGPDRKGFLRRAGIAALWIAMGSWFACPGAMGQCLKKDELFKQVGQIPAGQLKELVRQSCVSFVLTPQEEKTLTGAVAKDFPDILREHTCMLPDSLRSMPATVNSVLYDLANHVNSHCIVQHLDDHGGRCFDLLPETANSIKDAGGSMELIGFMAFVPLQPIPPPTITLTASPEAVLKDRTASLRWSVNNAMVVKIDHDMGTVSNEGQREVAPGTYTITAQGRCTSVSKTVTINVATAPPPVVINKFTAEPITPMCGQPTTLTWSVSNATETGVIIDPGVGAVPSEGQRQVSPQTTTTYILRARGAGGTGSEFQKNVTVEVRGDLPGASMDANGRLHVPITNLAVNYHPNPQYQPGTGQGVVTVEVTIDRKGRAKSPRALVGPQVLRQAAEQAVSQWRWQPVMRCGEPVEVVTEVSFDFHR